MGTQTAANLKNNETQTDNTRFPANADKCVQMNVNEIPTSTTYSNKESQTPVSFTVISKCLNDFTDGTIQKLESSLISSVDNFTKVHNNVTDLQNQIRKLTQERDALQMKKDKQQTIQASEKKKCDCRTLQAKTENLEKDIEKLKQ